MAGRALILGCGRVGALTAALLIDRGWRVLGVRRSQQGEPAPCPLEFGDLADAQTHERLRRRHGAFDVVFFTANPGLRGGGDNRLHDAARLVAASWTDAGRLVGCSSTAVYADASGREVDESGELARDARAAALLRIEQALQRHPEPVVLRAGALGGLERARRSRRLQSGRVALRGSPQRRLSWVHERDLARLLHRAAGGALGGGVLNACAPLHPSLASFYRRWAVALERRVSIVGDDRPVADRLVHSRRPELREFIWRLDWAGE